MSSYVQQYIQSINWNTVWNGKPVMRMPNLKYADIQLRAKNAVAVARSPWTQQALKYNWGTQWWEADVTFAAMSRAALAPWEGFMANLQGQVNPFLLNLPQESQPLGAALSAPLNMVPDPTLQFGSLYWSLPGDVSVVPLTEYTPPFPQNVLQLTSGSTSLAVSSLIPVLPAPAGSTLTIQYSANISSAFVQSGVWPGVEIYDQNFNLIEGAWMPTDGNYFAGDTTAGPGLAAYAAGITPQTLENVTGIYIVVSSNGASWPSGLMQFGQFAVFWNPNNVVQPGYPFNWELIVNDQNQNSAMMNPFVAAAISNSSSSTVQATGFVPLMQNVYVPGDTIGIGPRIYKVTQPVNADDLGNATISVFPYIRDNPQPGWPITSIAPSGLFELKANSVGWGSSVENAFGLDPIQLIEAL